MLTEHFLPLPSGQLNFAQTSTSHAPLLMLHGVTRRWQTFMPLMPSLAIRWRLLACDFRGHGKSSRVGSGYRVTDYKADAVELLRQADEPAVVYGHSLGAMVAAEVAAAHPDLVCAVVLEDPPFATMGRRITETPLHSFFTGLLPFASSKDNVARVARQLAELQIVDPATDVCTRLGDLRDAVTLRFMARSLKQLDPKTLDPIVSGQWLDGYNPADISRGLKCPVLLLQADPSAGGMLTDPDAETFCAAAGDVTHIKYAGTGHVIHWTRTQALLNHVHGFLDTLKENSCEQHLEQR
jgi:pimeloyl-ACP methyl ester carboxylesterase